MTHFQFLRLNECCVIFRGTLEGADECSHLLSHMLLNASKLSLQCGVYRLVNCMLRTPTCMMVSVQKNIFVVTFVFSNQG